MKKLLFLLWLLPVLVYGQSNEQNYVKTLIYREAAQNSDATKARADVTYFDGLGRPIQKIAGKMSGTGKDLIVPIEYDSYGRQARSYMPYPATTANLAFDVNGITNAISYYQTPSAAVLDTASNPYTETFYEASPLNRVLKQGAPGAAWKGHTGTNNNDHTIKFAYLTNETGEVKKLTATANTATNTITFTNGGNYAAAQLFKTITQNENKTGSVYTGTTVSSKVNTTEEFKNTEGQVILKRTFDGSNTPLDTYYVYDQYGNLTYVLPPLCAGSNTYINNLGYQYKYDARNRLIEKKLPGKQWEFIVYDALDRVIATGPSLTPFGGKTETTADQGWLYTYYDIFGRVAFTGWYSAPVTSTNRATLQTANTGTPVNAVRGNGTIDNVATNYTVPSALPTGFKLLAVNYYDDYLWLPTSDRPTAATQVLDSEVRLNVKGLPTGSWVRVLQSPTDVNGETSYSYFDPLGRVLRTKSINYLGGYLVTDNKIDFDGTVNAVVTKFKRLNADTELTLNDDFTYSPQDRLLVHTHNINASVSPQVLTANTYNELGQLQSKGVGGPFDISTTTTPIQQIDYKYNVRGWLTDINDINALGTDLFAYKISYNTIGNNVYNNISPLYNGNISETQWRSAADNIVRKYSYKYDKLNRLTDAYYQKPGQQVPDTGSYNESATYDVNGNIKSMTRTGGLDDYNNVVDIDVLRYTYPAGSNQLQMLEDNSGSPQGFYDMANGIGGIDYTYDANGNMRTDVNKGISSITYNHLNLPVEIVFDNNATRKINYFYNAAGVKVKKVVTDGTKVVSIDYLNGFQYKNAVLQFFPTAEGYVDYTAPMQGSSAPPAFNYVYQYKDHLGNVRMNFTMVPGKNGLSKLTIKDESHYYPFGLRHANYNMTYLEYQNIQGNIVLYPPLSTTGKQTYNYKYNGKELQDELGLNMYDYGARNYDPALGRWMNIDPLAEVSRRWSPYTYCYNNPVIFVDPDGMMANIGDDGLKTGANGSSRDNSQDGQVDSDDWRDKDGNEMSGDQLKNVKAYIFYDGTAFNTQAMRQYDDAVEKYGKGAVALSDTGSNEGFAQDWADMDGAPKEVMIIMHGKNQSINVNSETNSQITSTGDGKTNISGAKALNVQDLTQPKADLTDATLNMYSCHSMDRNAQAHGTGEHTQGALKGTKQPIADAFTTNFDFKQARGTTSSVNFSRLSYRPIPANGYWMTLDKKNGVD